MIAIVDYGAGNLRSVANAIAKVGYRTQITSQASDLFSAKAIVLPGVGAAADVMNNLNKRGLVNPIRQLINEGRPFLGVCIGLQVLFTDTEEGGRHNCLDIISGRVRKLPIGLKIPHMGWNQVNQKVNHPVFNGIPNEANFYFVHSYYVEPEDKSIVVGETDYDLSFCSVIARENLIATQFHPEKSGDYGLRIYTNFLKLAIGTKRGNRMGII